MLLQSGLSVRAHGRRSLEFKLEHELGRKDRPSFRTRALFVFPSSLAMSEERLSRSRWYANLRAYLRLYLPPASLSELAEVKLYFNAEDAVAEGVVSKRRAAKKLRRLFRLHAQRLRDASGLAREKVISELAESGHEAALASANSFVAELDAARLPLRNCAGQVRTDPDHKLGRLIRRCDEWLSLEVSGQLLQVMHALQEHDLVVPKACHDLLDTEERWRESQSYPSHLFDPQRDGSALLMCTSRLKKLMGTSLHLDLSAEAPSSGIQDLAFAIAASVAMLWAVGMQIITWWFVGNPVSPDAAPETILTFTVVAVLAYALKDKIKEGLRGWFRARIPDWLFDRKQVGRDDDEEMATAQESTRFLGLDELSDSDRAWFKSSSPLGVPVDVISYQRTTVLHADRLREAQPDIAGLTEIVRFALRPWLTHMDNLSQPFWHRDDSAHIVKRKALRMYPVVLLIELSRPKETLRFTYKLHVSQRGLEEVERV
jgi:hypothetical protein